MKLRSLFAFDRSLPAPTGGAEQPSNKVVATPDVPRTLELPKPTGLELLLELPAVPLTPARTDAFPEPQGVLQGMWSSTVDFFRGSRGTSELNRAQKVVGEVNELKAKMAAMSDAELKGQTASFKATIAEATSDHRAALATAEAALAKAPDADRAAAQKKVEQARLALYKAEQKVLDAIMPEAFAAVREAAKRATGMFHYDVQVKAGALMHRGMIAEMYTGEGKTLAATMPAYLGALAGHGFHVATVNDYLARRDAEEMGAIFGWLGMTVGVLQGDLQQLKLDPAAPGKVTPCTRQEAYQTDITYGTASEFGFDYLRDNQVRDPADRVQRPLYGAILDEVDSLLIDEARIPLILAKPGPEPDLERLKKYDQLAKRIHDDVLASLSGKAEEGALFDDGDIEWEEHWISLTDSGVSKVEKLLGLENLYQTSNLEELAYLQDALKAWFLMQESGQYAVVDGKISTVALSGHIGPGRRFTGGLHQALEAKHGLEVLKENVSSASITMREYLSLYQKRAGMTGTAMSAREVFKDVYGLDVARVKTRLELARVDYPDKVFATRGEKTEQFLKDLIKVHQSGRPILIGVEYTHTAEWLGQEIEQALKKAGIDAPVQILGAKSDAEEARIIAQAGRKGAITVATTRGGRGVDIKLGGNPKVIAEDLVAAGADPKDATVQAAKIRAKEQAEVLALGGLVVMAFEHLDSRRRDDQLRGRAGRQGEPGATIFYTSGEDRLYDVLKADPDSEQESFKFELAKAHQQTSEALDRSENRVNGVLSLSLPFDRILAGFRDKFYAARAAVLEASDPRPVVQQMIDQAIDDKIEQAVPNGRRLLAGEAKELYRELSRFLPLPAGEPPPSWTGRDVRSIRTDLDKLVGALFSKRDQSVGGELARVLEKDTVLQTVDGLWGEFLDGMLSLRDSIHFRAYAQKDPKQEFFREAGDMYRDFIEAASVEVAGHVLTKIPKLPPGFEPPSVP